MDDHYIDNLLLQEHEYEVNSPESDHITAVANNPSPTIGINIPTLVKVVSYAKEKESGWKREPFFPTRRNVCYIINRPGHKGIRRFFRISPLRVKL